MKLVPFFSDWAGSETKLDLKAYYRRPSEDGGISITAPLPLRRHLDWVGKGFTYICLSTLEELGQVAKFLISRDEDPLAMRECFDNKGRFKLDAYLTEQRMQSTAQLADLQDKVDRLGAEAVLEMMRMANPSFEFPASIKIRRKPGPKPKDERPESVPA